MGRNAFVHREDPCSDLPSTVGNIFLHKLPLVEGTVSEVFGELDTLPPKDITTSRR